MTASCASWGRPALEPAAPPQLEPPAAASEPCPLYILPESPTQGDLERGYATRGVQLVECDGRRQMAVDQHRAEHALEARWLEMMRREARRRWWKPWTW